MADKARSMAGKKKKSTSKHKIQSMTIKHGGGGKGYITHHEYARQKDENGMDVTPESADFPIGSQDELQQHIAEHMPEGGGEQQPAPTPMGAAPAAPMMAGGQ